MTDLDAELARARHDQERTEPWLTDRDRPDAADIAGAADPIPGIGWRKP